MLITCGLEENYQLIFVLLSCLMIWRQFLVNTSNWGSNSFNSFSQAVFPFWGYLKTFEHWFPSPQNLEVSGDDAKCIIWWCHCHLLLGLEAKWKFHKSYQEGQGGHFSGHDFCVLQFYSLYWISCHCMESCTMVTTHTVGNCRLWKMFCDHNWDWLMDF